MNKTVTVPLSEPFTDHGGVVGELAFRPPNLIEYFEIGEPITLGRSADGAVLPIENDSAFSAYVERCCTYKDPLLLRLVGLQDAMKIKEVILGFFAQARQANLSPASQTSSSSNSSS
ncbi:hypothetical protein [Microvirga antarctica]|uniref:hypothetical protein n=1 Tax=Microvirga antarctica TaxID=2819233 RepID=UPI001B303995|nr:hypothetical protein [Microvirga antarctica]